MRYKIGFVLTKRLASDMFNPQDVDFLRSVADFNNIEQLPDTITREFMLETLRDADVAVTCWGTPPLTDEMLAEMPKLRLVAHAAGAVKNLVPKSFFVSGRRICSNAAVIADDVAQTTLGLILTSLKQLWQMNAMTHRGEWKGGEAGSFNTRRLDGLNVGLVSASLVGREVVKYLKPFKCNILMYDPFLTPFEAADMGVTLMNDLNEMIKISDVLSLHAPANEDCRHMLNADNLPLLKDGALLVNTARGMLIDEEALIKELKTGRIMACLDVTDPEPPAVDSPLRQMDNVVLMPHMAGGHTQNGRKIMGRNIINEIYSFLTVGKLKNEIKGDMIVHMA